MRKKNFNELNNINCDISSEVQENGKSKFVIEEVCESDPAFCDETIEQSTAKKSNSFDCGFEQNVIDYSDSLDDCDSIIIDEDLINALKSEGTIFDVDRIKNDKALADKFNKYSNTKELREILEDKSKDVFNEPNVEQSSKTSEPDKQEIRENLHRISENIMKEKEEVLVVEDNKQIEIGENVKRIESPFSDVQRRSQYRASGFALASSPFLASTKVDNELTKDKEPIIVPERVVEKQTPIIIQNVQKANNEEINGKLYKLSERIDELSKKILHFENINQVIKETIASNNKDESIKPIEKEEKKNESDEIVCEVCGHINKKGSSVCEQCSNIFENA